MGHRIGLVLLWLSCWSESLSARAFDPDELVFEAGHPSLQSWLLPEEVPAPADNPTTADKVELGRKLFFDPRLSGSQTVSCASCHNPVLGWSDGLSKAVNFEAKELKRGSPSIVNAAYNPIQMWDGRFDSLEQQIKAALLNKHEMNTSVTELKQRLIDLGYAPMFTQSLSLTEPNIDGVADAIAAYERSVISTDTPFDRWVRGDKHSFTAQQVRGFQIFVDRDKGNCAVCHRAPNFTDNGFHNVGASRPEDTDLGRYNLIPIPLLKKAFKTPSLREVAYSAPYFHNGSSGSLAEVINHYIQAPKGKEALSPSMTPISLSEDEQAALESFLMGLSSPEYAIELPTLPH